MRLIINGEPREVDVPPDWPLLWVLRDTLGMTGTRFGCGAGLCGACRIHLDGEPLPSCVLPVSAAEGKQIRTIEGLADPATGALHPVQQAFIDEQVPQCGWCMSGQIMTAAALLEKNPSPAEDEINEALRGNYCRCGCYVRIRRAVQRAAEEMGA